MNLLTWLSRKRFPYEPLICVEISKARMLHNLAEFRRLAPKNQIAPVLKSNAYGHGLLEVAQILKDEKDIPFCVVDSYFEAIALRSSGFKIPLLVIGYTRPSTIKRSCLRNVAFTVTSLDMLKELARHSTEKTYEKDWEGAGGKIGFLTPLCRLRPHPIHIHLKIDTGMRRQGILAEQAEEAIAIIAEGGSSQRPLALDGICSHLSDADNSDDTFTESQIHLWNRLAKRFREAFPKIKHVHLSNTDGHYFTSDIDATVSRVGIGLYGLSDNPGLKEKAGLLPALEMKTIITGIKALKDGETVGYSNTYAALEKMTIATIPVGYYEGLDRRLSSGIADDGVSPEVRGFVLVGHRRTPCPIIGRVSMNAAVIDISGAPEARVGDQAVVMSREAADPNSIVAIAAACGTIAYEITVHVPAHLKRVVV